MKKEVKPNLITLGFFQATGLALYCSSVSLFVWNVEKIIGKVNSFLGPAIVLSILVVSILICGLLAFGKATQLFWDQKDTSGAVMLIGYTAAWLGAYILALVFLVTIL